MGKFKAFDDAFNDTKVFTQPERPFLLIYESKKDGVSVAWMESKEELLEVVEEVKGYGCKIIDAIEIGSCREVNYE